MAKQAIGIIETKGFIALIEASDAALKAADIKMTGWDKIGSGLYQVAESVLVYHVPGTNEYFAVVFLFNPL